MQPKLITSFFTDSGRPAAGLTPKISIVQITATADTPVVTNADMVEIGSGHYKFHFTTYEATNEYVISVDGGASLPIGERYQSAVNESFSDDIAEQVWEEPKIAHIGSGTTGEALNAIDANVDQLRIDTQVALNLLRLLVKHEQNRTVIDKDAKTLTVYDDDGVTVIHVFDLYDSAGVPSVIEVAERVPR